MNIYLKQFLILLFTFFLILWFQDCDDKKNKKERKTQYDTYKLPVLVCAVLGLILNFNELFTNDSITEEIIVVSQIEKPKINSKLKFNNVPKFSSKSDMEQQIYTELPDF